MRKVLYIRLKWCFFPSANPPWGGGEKLLRVPAHHSGLPRTSAEFCEYLRMLVKIIGQ